MMTRIFTHTLMAFCCILGYAKCHAQEHYGNEWIDYGQTYLRIPVVETGLYKITAAELSGQGIPIDSIGSSGIQMFEHGREVPIEVVVESAGRLGRDGYILFSGKKNDGYADTALYTKPEAMPHPYYNLYSDTTAYFLTWRNDAGPRQRTRFSVSETDTATFHFEELLRVFSSHYLPGRFFPSESNYEDGSLLSAYDEGEGWTGPEIAERTPFEIVLKPEKPVRERFVDIDCEILIAGWSPGIHSFSLWSGNVGRLKRRLTDLHVTGRQTKRIPIKLQASDIDSSGQLTLTLMPIGAGGHVSISYTRMQYPQAGPGRTQEPKTILTPRLVRFKRIDPETDYLIVTHPLMHVPVNGTDPVLEYAAYRASEKGGHYKPATVYTSELFDQFNAGQPGPQGIRNAIRWLHDKGHLKFVLLAGRSIDSQKARKMRDSWQVDMVPNAGWPGSDIALATVKGGCCPIVPIGRINALNSRQLLDYLRKVQDMEAQPPAAAWRRRIMHLSGGRSRDELNLFKSYVRSFEKKLENSALKAKVATVSKLTDNAVEQVHIDKQMNEGLGLVTLFGHSSIDMTDIDIGRASDPARNYRNHPRYPAIIANGCAAGAIFYSNQTLSSDWIFAPESGAVLFLAHTFNGPSTALKRYSDNFYEVLADSAFTNQPFGKIQHEAIRRNLSRNPGILDSITVQQMTLHGDPAICIFPAVSPDSIVSYPTDENNQPPLMLVTVNNRQLRNEEIIPAKPTVEIRVLGGNLPISANDTSLIAVWLKKRCNGCTDERISLRHATGKRTEPKVYEIAFELNLEPGQYTLTIQCRDLTGNSAAPYRIGFEVPAGVGIFQTVVAPNPSREWFRFTIWNSGSAAKDIEINITNPLGTNVFRKRMQCRPGFTESYWNPGILPAGIYHYIISTAGTYAVPPFPVEDSGGHLLYSP